MNTPRPTPETNAEARKCHGIPDGFNLPEFSYVTSAFASKLERERDEARIHFRRTIDELADEQQAHGLTKGKLTECQMEMVAMREAIKEVSLQLTFAEKVSRTSVLHIYVYDALIKLQPFLP